MVTTVSERGLFMIAVHEGLVPTRYRDLAGVDTFGIGHTTAAGPPAVGTMSFKMPRTDAAMDKAIAAAISVFERDIAKYEKEVVIVVGDHLPQNVFDAVVSWHYNTGGVLKSKATIHLREGRYQQAAGIIKQWNKVTVQGRKRISEALRKRREQEVRVMLNSHYPDMSYIPVWGTDGKGRVIWREIDSISFKEFVRALEGNTEVIQDRTTPNDDRGKTDPVAGMIAGAAALIVALVIGFKNELEEVFQWLF